MKQHATADYSRVLFEQMQFVGKVAKALESAREEDPKVVTPRVATEMVEDALVAMPIYWHQELNDLFTSLVGHSEASSGLVVLQPSQLMFRSGFIYFEQPVRMRADDDSDLLLLRSLCWLPQVTSGRLGVIVGAEALQPGENKYIGNWGYWTFGTQADAPVDPSALYGMNPNVIVDLRVFFWSVVTIMNQRLVSVQPERPNRAARKLIESHIPFEPQIQVITLRRPANPQPRDEHGIVDWKCRWIVRAHWRMQRVGPDRSEVKPVLVNAYVKGPEDRPLRPPRPTLVRVAA